MGHVVIVGGSGAGAGYSEGPSDMSVRAPRVLSCYLPARAKATISESSAGFPVGGLPVGLAHSVTRVQLVPDSAIDKDAIDFLSFSLLRPFLDNTSGATVASGNTSNNSGEVPAHIAMDFDLDPSGCIYTPNGIDSTVMLLSVTKTGTGQDFPQSILLVEYQLL